MHPLAIQRIRPRLSCQPLVAAVFSARSTVSPHCYQTWSTPEWRSYFVSSASTSAATMRPAPERQDACNQARARMKGSVLINDETSFAAALHRLNVPIRGSGSTAAGYRHFRVGRPNHAGAADPFGQQELDKVWMREQTLDCVIGCNDDERDRVQPLVVSICVWTDLRSSLQANVAHFDKLDAQKARAASPEWATHAQAELKGTHNYSTLAKISRRVCEEGKFFTIEALAEVRPAPARLTAGVVHLWHEAEKQLI